MQKLTILNFHSFIIRSQKLSRFIVSLSERRSQLVLPTMVFFRVAIYTLRVRTVEMC